MNHGVRRLLAACACLILLAGSGCANRDLNSPEYSSKGWYESEVSGIRVLTNARLELAERSLRKLARFLALARAVNEHELPPEPITLHLFDRAAQYRAFAGGGQRTGHAVGTPTGFYIALGSDRPGATTHILFHEIAHLLGDIGRAFPAWYREGYAEYLASAILRPGVATLGRALPHRVETLRDFPPLDLIELFQVRSPSTLGIPNSLRYYADAWAFVHFSLTSAQANRREPELLHLVGLLRQGKAPDDALATSYGETLEEMRHAYLVHRRQLSKGGAATYRHYLIPRIEEEISFRPVSSLVVDRDLADHAMSLRRYGVALGHYNAVLSVEPGDPGALLGRGMALAGAKDFSGADASIAAIDPDLAESRKGLGMVELLRYLAHYALSFESGEQDESWDPLNLQAAEATSKPNDQPTADARLEAAYRQLLVATELDPDCRRCWGGIAVFHARHPDGDPARGLEAVRKAGPFTSRGTVEAELLLRLERFEEARERTEWLIATSHDPNVARAARVLLFQILQAQN